VEWLYQTPDEFEKPVDFPETFTIPAGDVKILDTPLDEKAIRSLKVGDTVIINGTIFTGRDAVHKYLYDGGELDQIKSRQPQSDLEKGYVKALEGLLLARKSNEDRYLSLPTPDLSKNVIQNLKGEFQKHFTSELHVDYDRGYFKALLEYVKIIENLPTLKEDKPQKTETTMNG
jgi:hypothetical protein